MGIIICYTTRKDATFLRTPIWWVLEIVNGGGGGMIRCRMVLETLPPPLDIGRDNET